MLRTFATLVAVCAVAGCADPTADLPEAQVNESTEVIEATAMTTPQPAEELSFAAPPPEPPQDVAELRFNDYALTDQTAIGFEGFKVTGSHVGGFGVFEGSIQMPETDVHLAKIAVTIDMTSTYSSDAGLTKKLLGPEFFDVEQYPEATFNSTRIERDEGQAYVVSGDFTLHGVTKNISFPATIALNKGELRAEAEFTINRMDFGIEYPGAADDLIREKVLILLDIEAERVEG